MQDFTAYIAGSLDGTGKTSLIYWGCGKGDEIQALGEFDALGCHDLAITGPVSFKLGKTTKLLPAISYFVNQCRQAQRGIYIFVTDGRIDDLEQVKIYTKELALEIAVGKRNYLKLILIGIGNDVDSYQLQELDDFDTGLDSNYKITFEALSWLQPLRKNSTAPDKAFNRRVVLQFKELHCKNIDLIDMDLIDMSQMLV